MNKFPIGVYTMHRNYFKFCWKILSPFSNVSSKKQQLLGFVDANSIKVLAWHLLVKQNFVQFHLMNGWS